MLLHRIGLQWKVTHLIYHPTLGGRKQSIKYITNPNVQGDHTHGQTVQRKMIQGSSIQPTHQSHIAQYDIVLFLNDEVHGQSAWQCVMPENGEPQSLTLA